MSLLTLFQNFIPNIVKSLGGFVIILSKDGKKNWRQNAERWPVFTGSGRLKARMPVRGVGYLDSPPELKPAFFRYFYQFVTFF
jgi:hypothetical protein